MELKLLNFFKKSPSSEDVSGKIVSKISGDIVIIRPKLERLFKSKILTTDLAAALTSIYICQLVDIGLSKDKQEILKLSVNNLYNNFLGLRPENGSMRDWVAKFTEDSGDYADCVRFLHDKLDNATGPSDAAGAAFPLIGTLYEKLTGSDFDTEFQPLIAAGGQEWFNELGVICGGMAFDARDFIRDNKF
jgi:hypothetical protein